jgi:chromate reductase
MAAPTIAVLVGSLRKASFTRKVAHALEPFAPELSFVEIELGNLPLYNEDLDHTSPPGEWSVFRDRIREADGYLIATPEYNRSIPGVLKNALDVGSRPAGKNAFAGQKPGAVVSVSPYSMGGFGANHHVRQVLTYLDIVTLQQPEMYVKDAGKLFDGDGKLTDDDAKKLFAKFGKAFTAWVKRQR